MTLRNSFSVKRSGRLWVAVISAMVNILYYPVGTILALSSMAVTGGHATEALREAARMNMRTTSEGLNGLGQPGFMIAVCLAILIGLEGYHYLYSRTSEDFYESLPVKRSTRFWSIYAQGFLIWLVPYLICSALSILITAVACGVSGRFMASAGLAMVNMIFLFAAIYGIVILAAMLSGRMSIAILNTLFLMGIEGLYRVIFSLFASRFLLTWYPGRYAYRMVSSPIWYYLTVYESAVDGSTEGSLGASVLKACLKADLSNLMLAAIYIILAFLVYRKHRAEYAGDALIFNWARVAVKAACAGALGLLAMLFMVMLTGSNKSGFVFAVIITLLAAGLIQSIYEGDIRAYFHRFVEGILTAVAVVIVILGYRYDWIGYDRYVPAADDLTSYSFCNQNDYMGTYGSSLLGMGLSASYPSDSADIVTREVDVMQLEDAKDIVRLAEESRDEVARVKKDNANYDYWNVLVTYRLKNGREKKRWLLIPYSVKDQDMDAVITQEDYLAAMFPDVTDMLEDGGYGCELEFDDLDSEYTTVDGLDYGTFISAYQKDLENYDFETASRTCPLGEVTANLVRQNDVVNSLDYPVYASYSNTIALLQSMGVDTDTAPDASEAIAIEVSHYSDEDEDGEIDTDTISAEYTNPDEISEILAACVLNNGRGSWNIVSSAVVEDGYDVGVYTEKTGEDNPYMEYSFRKDGVPKFVVNDLN